MSDPTSNSFINKYFINNSEYFINNPLTIDNFRDSRLITPSKTSILEGTILSYSLDIGTIFCSRCRVNLSKSNYSKHLKEKYKQIYNSYKEDGSLATLTTKINTLDLFTPNTLKDIIKDNKYLFKELDIRLNGYKYKECLYINISRKEIRKYYNKEYTISSTSNTTSKASYIIDNIPI